MRAIRLKPLEQPPVHCEDYTDEPSVRRFEHAVRVRRAHTEAFEILADEDRADTSYLVRGSSGAAYRVDIVDASGQNDTCTCPDFLSNDLGSCKHIEAVRRAFANSRKLSKAWKALSTKPAGPTITVCGIGGLGLRAVGRWPSSLRKRYGVDSHSRLLPSNNGQLQPGRMPDGTRIVFATVPAVEHLRTLGTITKRERQIRDAAKDKKLGFDVLNTQLFSYQQEGVLHLVARGRAMLADDMGLGKTVQAIAACEVLRARGEARRILIVSPASLKDQWQREIRRHAGQRAMVVGGPAHKRASLLASDAPYVILNYELTWRELSRLQCMEADILILDEAQRAKNFRTKTASTLRAIPSRFAFILTGTPVENRLDDLYSLLQLVDPTVLGPLWKFNLDFHVQNEKGRIQGYKNLSALRERTSPIVLRRRKEEVLHQLPSLVQHTRYTGMTKEQRELEESFRSEAARYMAIAERRPLRPQEHERLQAALLKARQACNALELCIPDEKEASPKLDEFEDIVSEILEQGESKMLVFSEWVGMLELAAKRLDKLGVGHAMLCGRVPTEKRPALLERFRESPDQRVLLSSDAGGTGLNLQVATYVIHLDLPWNPARLDQRTARAHRLGQTRGVSAIYLCAEMGIERGIEQMLGGKREVRDAALDMDSTVEQLEAPSFSIFARQLREVLEATAEPGEDIEVEEVEPEPTPQLAEPAEAALPTQDPTPSVEAQQTAPEHSATEQASPMGEAVQKQRRRAEDRLRLAKVVLEAGFPADAARAAYDALAHAIAALLPEGQRPASHDALVAAIYRDLLPSGQLGPAAPGVLARLHDLTMLEAHGVELDASLAADVLGEAEGWVQRLSV